MKRCLPLLLLGLACGPSVEPHFPKVVVERVQVGELPRQVQLQGQARATRRASLNSGVSGTVDQVAAEVGDRVFQGQPLVWIDTRDLEAQIRQQQASVAQARAQVSQLEAQIAAARSQSRDNQEQARENLRQAELAVKQAQIQVEANRVDMQRKQELVTEKAIARAQFESAQLNYKISQEQLQSARSKVSQARSALELARQGGDVQALQAQLAGAAAQVAQAEAAVAATRVEFERHILKAPIPGVVVTRGVQPGQSVGPGGEPLLTLVDNAEVQVVAAADIRYAGEIKRNMLAQIMGTEGQARVLQVVPSSDPQTNTVQVRFRVVERPPELVDGAVVRLKMNLGKSRGVLLPRAALIEEQGREPSTRVVVGDELQERPLALVSSAGTESHVLVEKGLKPGDQVVVAGDDMLPSGSRVEVVHRQP